MKLDFEMKMKIKFFFGDSCVIKIIAGCASSEIDYSSGVHPEIIV